MRHYGQLLALLLLLSSSSWANELRFTYFDKRSGLQQNSIENLAQDRYGFVWVGTEDGLVRYDGNLVETYKNDPDDQYTIPDNVITAVFSGTDQRLWVGSEADGASYYDYQADRFVRMDTTTLGTNIRQFFNAQDPTKVLALTTNGLFEIDANNQIKPILEAPFSDKIITVYTQKEKLYAILKTGERLEITNDTKSPLRTRMIPHNISHAWHTSDCAALIFGKDGTLYCENDGITTISDLAHRLKQAEFDLTETIQDLAEDAAGTVWIATDIGLIQINDAQITLSQHSSTDEYSLSSNKLSVLLLGKSKELFIGTQTNGLNILNIDTAFQYMTITNAAYPHPKGIAYFPTNETCEATTPSSYNTVWSILKDTNGTLWVGTDAGLALKPQGKTVFQDMSRLGTPDNFIDLCSVISLAEIDGVLWIGTWGKGLIAYNTKTNTFVRYQSQNKEGSIPPDKQLSGDVIRLLLYDQARNSLWIGTNYHALSRIDFTRGTTHHYPANKTLSTALPHNRIRSLFLDNQNRLWVGSGGGLSLWNETDNTFKTLPSSNNIHHLSDEDVRAIRQIDDQRLLIGTGNGLNVFNTSEFKVEKKLYEKNGLANASIYSLLPDANHQWWLSTANGLSRFDFTNNTLMNFYYYDGLQSNEFNFNAWHKDNDGLLYFGGENGLNIIDPAKIASHDESSYAPVLTDIWGYDTNDQKQNLGRMISNSTEKEIKTLLRNIQFNHSTPHFTHAIKTQHYFSPLSKSWSELRKDEHDIEYTNLQPGRYELRLRSPLANLTEMETKLAVTIQPYLWENSVITALIKAALLLLLIAVIFYFHRIKSKIAAERMTRQHYHVIEHELRPHLHEIDNQLSKLLQSDELTGEHRHLISKSTKPLAEKSIRFIYEIKSLIDIQNSVNNPKNAYMLEDIIDEVLLFFNKQQHRIVIRENDSITLHVHQDSVYLIIRNLISNAIKYSPEDSPVHVNVTSNHTNLIIECIDWGCGISTKHKNTIYKPYTRLTNEYSNIEGIGIGMTIVRFIVHTYRGKISITDNYPTGSHVTVMLPGIISHEE